MTSLLQAASYLISGVLVGVLGPRLPGRGGDEVSEPVRDEAALNEPLLLQVDRTTEGRAAAAQGHEGQG